ncbi:MAG: phosphatidylserine decarboxylase [Waddliaceae bacterium]|nr:phosphatidylserine decarboxylase [Waddliaceae bacterium]MBT3579152.1 phosphatidylserine decarboxylase [Waddliaceae bacterium]MBT4444308.1 phosphatidylserine decarboxylase [Waddliaceae bacterium]MBT6928523.1 phosphatidylserine decarboxylase [Waddliaceae bacterium]MBT7264861.1 phosphatidylserine decarboxylase [Waddliaceae bacterium]
MKEVNYLDRKSGAKKTEKVLGAMWITIPYGSGLLNKIFGAIALFISKTPIFSALYGWLQRRHRTTKKIRPFVEGFDIDVKEFADDIDSFVSFDDFFSRKLTKEARPITVGDDVAMLPADARYTVYQHLDVAEEFFVKGHSLDLSKLLKNEELAKDYAAGSMVIARLCPADYHRFHFPCDCIPGPSHLINGWLYSVNPVAFKKNADIFMENKRTVCALNTETFDTVLYLEVGATNVGSITQTYECNVSAKKGDEKGFFSFGASTIILLFKPDTIVFDEDLVKSSEQGLEVRGLMGQRLGKHK